MSDSDINDIQLKIQALADNELPAEQIDTVLDAIQGSYEYRQEYAEILRLKRKLGPGPAIPEDWLARAERAISRRIGRGLGMVFFIGSYLGLLGYGVYTLFRSPDVSVTTIVLVCVMLAGFVFLLGNAIADRVRESRTDKYRGVIR